MVSGFDEDMKNEKRERIITLSLGLLVFFIVFYLTFILMRSFS